MKKSAVLKGVLAVFVLSVLLIPSWGHAAEKVITLKFAHFVPATTLEGKTMQAWANEVEKRTNGRVKVNIFPGATLMPPSQTYDGITKEVADIGYGIFAYHRGRFPLTEVIDLPLGYKNPYVPTRMINEYYKKFKPKELEDVKVLFLEAHGADIISTRKPISKLADIKGMKLRASGLSAKIVNALGGSAVGLPITDTYDAMSKGVIEGLVLDWGGLYNWKFGDLVKNHIESPGVASTVAFYTVMNKDKWNSLPQDIKNIIDKLDEEWIDRVSKKWGDWENMGKTELLKRGGKIITLSKEDSAQWVEKMRPILDDYVQASRKKGLPGDQALKFCQDYLKANDK
ncbi:MAG: C4-dicarboxylate-binding periplasmic protein precursor [Syntrophorhabdaceae bacterium PtaU1.Bin034]|jgi:TRAP-type C4-dicarboxylate transport system substrate-binding protein|nr:MAG: C4-dicarboxylate-binding periplasmic protein precursor [Syntrophorhabdaceae bacterium PtaU1.Bin034]